MSTHGKVLRTMTRVNNHADVFWIGGVGISLILLAQLIPRKTEEAAEWTQYCIVSSCLPLGLLTYASYFNKYHAYVSGQAVRFCAGLFYAATIIYLYSLPLRESAALALVSTTLGIIITSPSLTPQSVWTSLEADRSLFRVITILLVFLSGIMASRLHWWSDPFEHLFGLEVRLYIALTGLLAILVHALFREPAPCSIPRKGLRRLQTAVASVLLLLASSYVDPHSTLHHWSYYVGPAELVRSGGELLWSVPSQYGFLSILSISALPFDSPWQSFYVLNAAFIFISALVFFLVMTTVLQGPFRYFMSFVLTICFVFVLPGSLRDGVGPSSVPSVGAYRFLGTYLLLGLLYFGYRRNVALDGVRFNLLGSLICALSVLWSVESGVYVSVIWFSFLFTLTIGRHILVHEHRRIATRATVIRLGIPFVLLITSGISVSLAYLWRTGHLPDFKAYYEVPLQYQRGFGSLVIDSRGAVGLLLFLFFLNLALLLKCAGERKHWKELSVVVANTCGFIILSTYFVGRSHDNNILNLMPLLMLISFINAKVTSPCYPAPVLLVRIALLPVAVVALFLAIEAQFHDKKHFVEMFDLPRLNGDKAISKKKKNVDELLRVAQVLPKDALVCYFRQSSEPSASFREWAPEIIERGRIAWLPLKPGNLFRILDDDRKAIYLKRFIEQTRLGGVLIIQTDRGGFRIDEFLRTTHSESIIWENNCIKVARYTYDTVEGE